MKDHKKPKLKLVKGQAKTRTRLTAKQSKFIDGILGIGVDQPLTLTHSYKASYDCKNFSDANVRKEAHLLFRSPNLTPIYEDRKRQIEERHRTQSLNRSHQIITGLEREASDFEHGSPTSRVRALELLGKLKTIRLFSSDISVEESRDADQIKEELEAKIKTLLGD